jgi:hypothetical protein
MAAAAGFVGTGLAIAATQNRRAYYDDYYGGGLAYYGGGPVYGGTNGDPGYHAAIDRAFPPTGAIRSPAGRPTRFILLRRSRLHDRRTLHLWVGVNALPTGLG